MAKRGIGPVEFNAGHNAKAIIAYKGIDWCKSASDDDVLNFMNSTTWKLTGEQEQEIIDRLRQITKE